MWYNINIPSETLLFSQRRKFMKKNILSVIGAATVAAVALKLTTKYVKNEVIKELEDDGYLYDDDDCDDCDECCGCDERIDDIHHAPVAAVHVIRVERKHDETKKDTDKATEANPDADKDESGKVDSDSASEVTKAKDESAEKPVEEKAAEEKKNEPDIVVPVKQPAKKDDDKSDLNVHVDEIIDSFSGPNA
jgi:hypothetical protein